jgi:allantoinase
MPWDLLIRGGEVVTPDGVRRADVAVEGGTIVELAEGLSGGARETIDASGLHVFPGLIDPHVHFNEPGRTEWEGFETGSSALAAGGGTCFFDMPLNSSPPTLDGESFDLKLAAARANSYTDFGLWGGLTPGNLDRMEELAERGVVGFKAFMCNSGMDDFPRADDWTLQRGMNKAAELGLPVAVHAENQELVAGKTAWMRSMLPTLGARDWAFTRDPFAEADAIQRAALLAASGAGCALHVVHVSNRYCVELAATFRVYPEADISIETCPHYFMLNAEDVESLGAVAKCAPPIRVAPHGDQLWERVLDGTVDVIGSDHSPSPPEMKAGDFFATWGGVAGVQSTLASLLTREPRLPLERVSVVTAGNVAHRFDIPRKGRPEPGHDADMCLVDVGASYELTRDMLLDRHKLSPYVGRRFRGVVRRTIVRGHTVYLDGKIVAGSFRGRLVTPMRKGATNA